MEAMREAWTDDRPDDLANRMDRGFDRVDTEIRELRAETKSEFALLGGEVNRRFDKVDERFDEVDVRFEHLDSRLDSIQHAIVMGAVALTAAAIAGFVAIFTAGL
jgi:hypothetical protein